MESGSNRTYPKETLDDEIDNGQILVPDKKSWKNLFAYMGPGFLVSIAYIDPGNFQADLQSGAQYKYGLLWIILVASCSALLMQSLAANLGVVTGNHLAEHCRKEYPRILNYFLWVLAEISVIASDIPEVIGTSFALNMLFGIPLWCGVLITGFSTLFLLLLQQYGVRKLEALIALLVLTIAYCFLAEMKYAKPDASEVLHGLFIPQLKGSGATKLAISLLGAMVMPHNLFLHSALVLSRKIPRSVNSIKEACKLYLIESGLALTIAFLINVSVISVTGAVCHSADRTLDEIKSCRNLDLNEASFLLKNVLGKWSSKLFAIALLASGISSTITGTYAGQYVMQGFLNLRLKPWIRNMLTRSLAIVPSLIVSICGGSSGAGNLIIIASMILSFELPFALVPLLKFTSCETKMGTYVNSKPVSATTWVIGSLIMGINIFYLAEALVSSLRHTGMKTVSIVFCGGLGFVGMAAYLTSIGYLIFRKNKEGLHLIAITNSEAREGEADLNSLPRGDLANMQLLASCTKVLKFETRKHRLPSYICSQIRTKQALEVITSSLVLFSEH